MIACSKKQNATRRINITVRDKTVVLAESRAVFRIMRLLPETDADRTPESAVRCNTACDSLMVFRHERS